MGEEPTSEAPVDGDSTSDSGASSRSSNVMVAVIVVILALAIYVTVGINSLGGYSPNFDIPSDSSYSPDPLDRGMWPEALVEAHEDAVVAVYKTISHLRLSSGDLQADLEPIAVVDIDSVFLDSGGVAEWCDGDRIRVSRFQLVDRDRWSGVPADLPLAIRLIREFWSGAGFEVSEAEWPPPVPLTRGGEDFVVFRATLDDGNELSVVVRVVTMGAVGERADYLRIFIGWETPCFAARRPDM